MSFFQLQVTEFASLNNIPIGDIVDIIRIRARCRRVIHRRDFRQGKRK